MPAASAGTNAHSGSGGTRRVMIPMPPENENRPRGCRMASEESFAEWIRRVRAGDERAAEELVRRYETAVRVAVRVRLTDGRLRQQLDSMDICQSVLGSFFVRAAAGQYDLDHPEQLVGLLVKMAQNKLFMQVRRHRTVGRDLSRARPLAEDVAPVPDREPGPERQAAGRDMLQRLLERLPEPVRDLARRRGEGPGVGRDRAGTRRPAADLPNAAFARHRPARAATRAGRRGRGAELTRPPPRTSRFSPRSRSATRCTAPS